jgi:hypothetical protein
MLPCGPSQVADLSMGDLLLHATVAWLNPPSSLGKWKKEPQLATFGTFPPQAGPTASQSDPAAFRSDKCFSASSFLTVCLFFFSLLCRSIQNGRGVCVQGRLQAKEEVGE